jgi:hypothetical protein
MSLGTSRRLQGAQSSRQQWNELMTEHYISSLNLHLRSQFLHQLDAVDELPQQLHSGQEMPQLLRACSDVLQARHRGMGAGRDVQQ